MHKSKLSEGKSCSYNGDCLPERMRQKLNDGRRRRRSAPSSHPWRQYKSTQRTTK